MIIKIGPLKIEYMDDSDRPAPQPESSESRLSDNHSSVNVATSGLWRGSFRRKIMRREVVVTGLTIGVFLLFFAVAVFLFGGCSVRSYIAEHSKLNGKMLSGIATVDISTGETVDAACNEISVKCGHEYKILKVVRYIQVFDNWLIDNQSKAKSPHDMMDIYFICGNITTVNPKAFEL